LRLQHCLQIDSFEYADALGKQNGKENSTSSFASDAEKCSELLMGIQMSRAPRVALGCDQHDIAHKRLKVDLFLAMATRFARNAETLPSQRRN
jgi:hypothetical protein